MAPPDAPSRALRGTERGWGSDERKCQSPASGAKESLCGPKDRVPFPSVAVAGSGMSSVANQHSAEERSRLMRIYSATEKRKDANPLLWQPL
jgi:hypothetical protein